MKINKTWFKTEIEISIGEMEYLTNYAVQTNNDAAWRALYSILKFISNITK